MPADAANHGLAAVARFFTAPCGLCRAMKIVSGRDEADRLGEALDHPEGIGVAAPTGQ
ncbi:MAG: hypothetical protein PGN34_12260 [Methylobacterium frigidaeris]